MIKRDFNVAYCLLAALVCWLGSNNISYALSEPRLRVSDYFGAPGGIKYINPDNLGHHCYSKSSGEKSGMVYTQRAGFVDIGHVREAADRTRYAATVLNYHLVRSSRRLKFSMIEPSTYYITVRYPVNWKYLDKTAQEEIVRDLSIRYGQYLAHQSLIWHELVTWFGYASSGLFSEQISSFSWEDSYSDLTGTWLGAEAMQSGGSYDDQVIRLLAEKLNELKAEPASIGKKAGKYIKDAWYTGDIYFFVTMKKRNFDVGFDDGQITPWLVPGMYPDVKPLPCPVPDTNCLADYGFQIKVRMDPRVAEKTKIYKALALDPSHDWIQVDRDFPRLLDHIQRQAQTRYGADVDKPTL